jgi:predicted Zn-dependent protease with MMP-like domain
VSPANSIEAFRVIVAEALDDLPDYVQARLENVAVVVEERPRPSRMTALGYQQDLLGLYEGVNRVDRSSGYHLAVPDRITLFWRPILDEVGTGDRKAIREEVRRTVIHEVAHHFGFGDPELDVLEGRPRGR